MIRSVVQYCLNTYHWVCRQRPFQHGFLQTLFHGRIIVLGHRASHYLLLKHISLLQILGRAETHFHMTVLAVSAGLLLILILYIRLLLNRLPVGYLGSGKLYLHLVFI